MKEFIKILDDLRSEDVKFDFNPLNRNLCFGGGGGGGVPKIKPPKITLKPPKGPNISQFGTGSGGTLGQLAGGVSNVGQQIGANLATNVEGAFNTVGGVMEKVTSLGKSKDDGDDSSSDSASTPGAEESVGESSSKVQMKQAEAAKGQKAKAGAKGKRALRKVGAQ